MVESAVGTDQQGSGHITSSLSSIFARIRQQSGLLDVINGFVVYSAVQILATITERIIKRISPSFIPEALTKTLAAIILIQVSAYWIWVVLTPSDPQFWLRRLPLTWFEIAQSTWLAAVFLVLVNYAVDRLLSFFPTYEYTNNGDGGKVHLYAAATNGLPYIVWQLFQHFLLSFYKPTFRAVLTAPAMAIWARATASLLPPNEKTVVMVDRSSVSTTEALKAIGTLPFFRLGKIYAKLFLLRGMLEQAFWTIVLVEVGGFAGRNAAFFLLKTSLDMPVTVSEWAGLSEIARNCMENMVEPMAEYPTIGE